MGIELLPIPIWGFQHNILVIDVRLCSNVIVS